MATGGDATQGVQEDSFFHPMDQFIIHPLLGEEMGLLSITNATVWMAIAVGAISALTIWGTSGRTLVPTRIQSCAELLYGFVRQMVEDVAGKDAMAYFPYIFTIFTFVLFANTLGMIPLAFTPTSHIAITVFLALTVFISVTALGFYKHGSHFLSFFWPKDAPVWLRPLLAIIEVISYLVRPVSHSIRLGANMMAGHAVLKVFAGLVALTLAGGLGPVAVLPFGAMVGLTAFEILVAVIQAYIFAVLTCVYLSDALHLH